MLNSGVFGFWNLDDADLKLVRHPQVGFFFSGSMAPGIEITPNLRRLTRKTVVDGSWVCNDASHSRGSSDLPLVFSPLSVVKLT